MASVPPPLGVIFDLDGVLLDSEPLYTEATQRVVAPFGKVFDWALKSRVMGKSSRESAELLIQELQLSMSPTDFLTQRKAHLQQLLANVPAMPGAREFLAKLRDARVPVAIATSSSRTLCEVKLSSHAWLREVTPFLCGDDSDIARAKPAPDIYLAAAARLGLEADRCIALEDSPAGVQAALAAGMRVVAMPAAELDAALVRGATWLVSSYAELNLEMLGLC